MLLASSGLSFAPVSAPAQLAQGVPRPIQEQRSVRSVVRPRYTSQGLHTKSPFTSTVQEGPYCPLLSFLY